ncbi:unnamed protein product [Caenorhabditis nigoni]
MIEPPSASKLKEKYNHRTFQHPANLFLKLEKEVNVFPILPEYAIVQLSVSKLKGKNRSPSVWTVEP